VLPGKGEVLWRSLAATTGDVLVFIDADLEDFSSSVVTALVGPLLLDRSLALVKGLYDRPLRDGERLLPAGGGRVTELVARPLIALDFPELSGLVQPLAGEWAVRRSLFERLHVPTGYAVELAALVDTVGLVGLDAIAQVDLGRRAHRHQALRDLGAMATQIVAAAQLRRGARDPLDHRDVVLRQYHPAGGGIEPVDRVVPVGERPPASGFAE
jgi:glucosyl-3-phosphoglycerate synthase